MDTRDRRKTSHADLAGLRVLVMFHSAHQEHQQRFARLIEAAKGRWGWHLDVLCHVEDRRTFEELVAPSGKTFARPAILEVAPWESNAEYVADVERRLRKAELVAQTPVGQIAAAAPASIGRAYVASVRHRLNSPMARRVLEDNTEPFRIVRRFFCFADDMLAASRPDLVVAHEWATPLQFSVWLAATGRNIPCVAVRPSKLHSEHRYWTTDRLMFNRTAIAGAATRRSSGASVSDAAKSYIRAFREQPKVTAKVEMKWHQTGKKWRQSLIISWVAWPLRFTRGLAIDLLCRIKGLDQAQRAPLLERVMARDVRVLVGRRHQRFLSTFDDAALAAMKYVYFPMHKESDLPLTFQATPWQDQRNTVQILASCLPFGYRLFVREHRANYGQRPTSYYRHLLQLPNVVLIDPFDSQYKYLRNADLIVTESGSSGWEGLLLGRRVLTLAPNFYEGAGLSIEVHDLNRLSATVVETLSSPAVVDPVMHDRNLGHMIDAELATVFPDDEERISDAVDHLGRTLTGVVRPRAADRQAVAS